MPPHMYVRNTVSLAMARLNMILAPEVHHPQENINIDNEITIDDQILIRTSRYPQVYMQRRLNDDVKKVRRI